MPCNGKNLCLVSCVDLDMILKLLLCFGWSLHVTTSHLNGESAWSWAMWTSCFSKTPTIPPNDITFGSKTCPHLFVIETIRIIAHSSAILVCTPLCLSYRISPLPGPFLQEGLLRGNRSKIASVVWVYCIAVSCKFISITLFRLLQVNCLLYSRKWHVKTSSLISAF